MRNTKKILVDNATPEGCVAILLSMKKGAVFSKQEIFSNVEHRNVKVGPSFPKNILRLLDLRIIRKINQKEFAMTEYGNQCKELMINDLSLFYEYMHHIHMINAFNDEMRAYFLTYYLIIKNLIGEKKNRDNARLISIVISDLRDILGSIDAAGFDDSSVSKAIRWIKPFEPEVLRDDGSIKLRSTTNVKIELLAISAYYRTNNVPFGTPLMMTPEVISEISMLGFINDKTLSSNMKRLHHIYPPFSINDTVDGKSILLRGEYGIEELL